ncbi:MAG: GspMb/PilO family protein [Ferrovibrionaceae bacterium]
MSLADNMRAAFAPVREQIAQAMAPLVAQVRSNRRLAIALALIPVMLWGYLVLSTQAWVDDAVSRLNQRREEVARLERVAGDAAWARRAREADARRSELENRLWRIETEGLARAEFQEWLLSSARKAGIGRPTATSQRTDGEATAQAGYRAISVSLSGDFSPESLQALLATIANEKRLIIINSMRIQRQPLPRIDMVLTAYGLPVAPGSATPTLPPQPQPQPAASGAAAVPAAPSAPPVPGAGTPPVVVPPGIPPQLAPLLAPPR